MSRRVTCECPYDTEEYCDCPCDCGCSSPNFKMSNGWCLDCVAGNHDIPPHNLMSERDAVALEEWAKQYRNRLLNP